MQPKRIHRRSLNERGHAHELTFCCFRRYKFLSAERTCRWLADSIQKACVQFDFSLWAFVFMPDHVHLIVHPNQSDYDISEFLAEVKRPTSRKALAYLRRKSPEWLEKLKTQRGTRTESHFWERGGGFDRNVIEPSTLQKMIDYIHMNPVRQGLVAKAVDWKWSSARWFIKQEQLALLPVARIPYEWTIGMSNE